MERFVIYGADHVYACELVESLNRIGAEIVAGILVGEPKWSLTGIRCVLQHDEFGPEVTGHSAAVSYLGPGRRLERISAARDAGFTRFPNIVDPTAIVASSVILGRGVYVNAGAVIGTFVQLADHAFVNRAASIGHHTRVQPFATIGPQVTVASSCLIGMGAFIGAGATLAPSVKIGANSVIGAGAVVIRDVEDNTMVVGNPARVIKEGIPGYGGLSVPVSG